jgi:hypothetical protein
MGALLYGFWGCYVFFLTICLTELLISYSERLDLVNEISFRTNTAYRM